MAPGLSGSLYGGGPSPQYATRDTSHQWFSGDGMVNAFHIHAGNVAYSNRWARTPKWQLEHAAGRALLDTFGNPATTAPPGRRAATAAWPKPACYGMATGSLHLRSRIQPLNSILAHWLPTDTRALATA